MNIPDGYELVLKGRGEQWRARLIPDGYVNKWSARQPVEAKARTPEEAVAYAIAKCPDAP